MIKNMLLLGRNIDLGIPNHLLIEAPEPLHIIMLDFAHLLLALEDKACSIHVEGCPCLKSLELRVAH